MKKKINLLLIILSIFFAPMIANAADGKLSAGDIEMECVYDNGRSLSIYYSNDAYGINISTFKLSNAVTPPYSTSLSFFLNESARAEEILKSVSCPNSIQSALIEQKKVEGDNTNTMQFEVLFVSADAEKIMNTDVKTNFVAGFTPTSGRVVNTEVVADSVLGKRLTWGHGTDDENLKAAASFSFYLKSERIYFNNEVEPKRQWAFKSEGTQAASNPTYVRFYEYETPGGSIVQLAEKSNLITRDMTGLRTHESGKTQFICFFPSTKMIESEKNDVTYSFSIARHSGIFKDVKKTTDVVEGSNGVTCPTGYSLYKEVSWDEASETDSDATSICDIIPETSLLIAKVVKYAGILVPVLLIVLTAVDITKIVLTGNIEEELPKRKKLIIIRFVVAVFFFFLPFIIQLVVASDYGVDFGDISCLW